MRTRALELMLATLMVTCGFALLWTGDTFALPHYSIMKTFIGEVPGGWFLFCVGVARWAAILRNGDRSYTALTRLSGCCVGGGFWLTLAVSMEAALFETLPLGSGPPMLLPVAITAFGFEAYSAVRGARDAKQVGSFAFGGGQSKVAGNAT